MVIRKSKILPVGKIYYLIMGNTYRDSFGFVVKSREDAQKKYKLQLAKEFQPIVQLGA